MPNRNRRLLAVFVAVFSCVVSCFAISSRDTDVTVLVATERIRPGDRLTERNTAFRELPKHRCPSDAVVSPGEIEERALKVCCCRGDVITREYLTERGSHSGINVMTRIRVSTIPFSPLEKEWKPSVGDAVTVWLYPRASSNAFDPLNLFTAEVFAVESVKGTSTHYHVHSNRRSDCEQAEEHEKISILLDVEQLMKMQLAKKKGLLRVSSPSDS